MHKHFITPEAHYWRQKYKLGDSAGRRREWWPFRNCGEQLAVDKSGDALTSCCVPDLHAPCTAQANLLLPLSCASLPLPSPPPAFLTLYANGKSAVRVDAPGVRHLGPHFFLGDASPR